MFLDIYPNPKEAENAQKEMENLTIGWELLTKNIRGTFSGYPDSLPDGFLPLYHMLLRW